jgi:cytoskeletal protein CcmA (bactofilin family)
MGGAVTVLVTALAAAAQQPAPTPGAYAVLGLDDVTIAGGARVASGSVGANRGTVRLGPGARIDGSVVADTIRIAAGARAGDMFCRLVVGPLRFGCATLSAPIVDVAELSIVQVLPGAAEVRVPAGAGTAPLLPGAYGGVRVGPRGRLLLAGGDYAVRTITIAAGGHALCAAACRIAVEDRVLLRSRALLGAAAPLDPNALEVSVERDGIVAGPGATITGSVYAPEADVRLGPGARFTGRIVGRNVIVGSGARVTGADAP